MKAMIGAVLMVLSAAAFSAVSMQAASANEHYFWKGFRYQVGPYYGCWVVRYNQRGWNENCDCQSVQRVVVRDGRRFVTTVRECSG